MKITKLLMIALAVVCLSCGDDDNDPQPANNNPSTGTDGGTNNGGTNNGGTNTNSLVGVWAATDIDYSGSSTTTTQGITTTATFTGKGKNMTLTLTLKESPATFTSEGDYTIALTTTIEGYSYTQDTLLKDFLANGTWAQDGKTLTVTGPAGPQKATIVEQTATTFKIEADLTTSQAPTQGVTVVSKVHGTYTFKKK